VLTEHDVPNAEDGTVVFVDAVSIATVMNAVEAGSIEDVIEGCDSREQLSIKTQTKAATD
jgi:hypothetical protein